MSKKQKDNLGDRMKQYENCFKQKLPKRMPLIIRCDGKAFHSYTKPLKSEAGPINSRVEYVMNLTAVKLCSEIQGVELAYIQSDEISLLINNYKNLNSEAWFDNELQKIVSVSASIASTTFSINSNHIWYTKYPINNEDIVPVFTYNRPAYFDSRAFILPESEVCNYFIWRLKDCRRNSVSIYAHKYFSNKELHKKTSNQKKEMLLEKGVNWDLLDNNLKNGRIVLKEKNNLTNKSKWVVKNDFPLFWENRDFVDNFLKPTITKEQ